MNCCCTGVCTCNIEKWGNYLNCVTDSRNQSYKLSQSANTTASLNLKFNNFQSVFNSQYKKGVAGGVATLDGSGTIPIKQIPNQVLPVGSIIAWIYDVIPDGWLLANGDPFDVNLYPKLAELEPTGFLKDLRGYFLRGLDLTGTIDPDGATRVVGSIQNDDFKSHNHNEWQAMSRDSTNGDPNAIYRETFGGGTGQLYGHPTTGLSGGAETRPKNIAVNFIIKAE